MKCLICKERDATPDAEVCEDINCIKAYLASGRGSISGNPYKTFMRHCRKVVEELDELAKLGEEATRR